MVLPSPQPPLSIRFRERHFRVVEYGVPGLDGERTVGASCAPDPIRFVALDKAKVEEPVRSAGTNSRYASRIARMDPEPSR